MAGAVAGAVAGASIGMQLVKTAEPPPTRPRPPRPGLGVADSAVSDYDQDPHLTEGYEVHHTANVAWV